MHPIVPRLPRQTCKDLVVPLHRPILDKDGKTIHELALKKDTVLFLNFIAYNRHPDLWGSDPQVFRPERWFDMNESRYKFGVYANL
jgi:cytochrome P450